MGLMSEHGQEIILMSALMGSFGVAIVCMTFIPEPFGRIIGGIAYFMVLFSIFLGGKYSTQLKYGPYPHYEFFTRPDDDEFNVFADNESVLQTDDNGEVGTIIFHSHFTMLVPGYTGRKSKVALYYDGKIGDRVSLRSRTVSIAGFVFDHPQSDKLVVKPQGSYLDHGVEIPAFKLLNGALDGEPTWHDVGISSSNGKTKPASNRSAVAEDDGGSGLVCGKCGSELPLTVDDDGFVQCSNCAVKNRVD